MVASRKDIFVFSKLINTKIVKASKSKQKVVLMIKNRPGFMGSLVNSLIKVWWH